MGSIFEPQRKIDNKIWATRNARRPVISKRTISVKKVMLAIFFLHQRAYSSNFCS